MSNHFNEGVSPLSRASTGGELSFPSPLTTKDLGIPSTPEGRPIVRIDEEMIEVGYDSDHQQAPWEGIQEDDYAAQTLEEEELLDGPPAVSSEGEVSENVEQKIEHNVLVYFVGMFGTYTPVVTFNQQHYLTYSPYYVSALHAVLYIYFFYTSLVMS